MTKYTENNNKQSDNDFSVTETTKNTVTDHNTAYYEGYKDGADNAWELAEELYLHPTSKRKIFGSKSYNYLIQNCSGHEVLEKVKAYEQEIKVGDEVYTAKDKNGECLDKGIVLWIDRMAGNEASNIGVMSKSGHMYSETDKRDWHKTGRHYDLQPLFNLLKE